jgi:hypothetical protein
MENVNVKEQTTYKVVRTETFIIYILPYLFKGR